MSTSGIVAGILYISILRLASSFQSLLKFVFAVSMRVHCVCERKRLYTYYTHRQCRQFRQHPPNRTNGSVIKVYGSSCLRQAKQDLSAIICDTCTRFSRYILHTHHTHTQNIQSTKRKSQHIHQLHQLPQTDYIRFQFNLFRSYFSFASLWYPFDVAFNALYRMRGTQHTHDTLISSSY